MSKILDLMDKRAKAWDAAKKFLDTHSENGGMVSAEDAATYEKMEKEVTDLTKDIERLQRQDEIEKMMNQPTSAPITNMPGKTGDTGEDKPGRASAAYKKAFWDNIRHPGNPVIRDVLEEGTDGNGGYLVPTEFEHTLVRALDENNIMRTIGCKVITTQNERKIPVANGHTQATWTAENGAYTESNPTFSQTSIDAFKLTDLIKVSDELLADSFFDIEGYISEEFGRAFGEAEEDAFINGAIQAGATAIDRPTGLMIAAASGGAPSGVTTAANNKIDADELISLVYSLKAPYRSKAKFLMNDATVAYIRKLKDGNGVYMWQPALTAGEPDRLLGYPLYTSPKVPTMAAGARAIAFGDFSCYWIADRAGRSIKRLNELYATNGQVGFTCTERVDGKLILSEGIKILDMHS
jgi:HK97 family phage major capsid protein